jgi:arylsulfatase
MVLEDSPWMPPQQGFYSSDAYTDYAVERIREHGREHASQPLFLYLAYTAPHFPLHAPPEHIARYKGRYDIG